MKVYKPNPKLWTHLQKGPELRIYPKSEILEFLAQLWSLVTFKL
jgi:hypothetical protein